MEKKVIDELIKDDGLKKKYMKAVEECDMTAKADKCETTYEYLKCLDVKVLSETFKEVASVCNKENGFTGDIEELNFNSPDVSREAKCAVACSFEKKGVLKSDGTIDKEVEKKVIDELIKDDGLKKKYMKAIEECDISAKADKCETTYEYLKCLDVKVR
ncbi:unnamed protein product [Nezara viridula]|uniref:Uncharacterized protein n=1 Tax=Nezara viridula TaxID=85310 RepID=A0A9P0EBV0_NEZVI|nr:unnamed protein product [Nezara viridula]